MFDQRTMAIDSNTILFTPNGVLEPYCGRDNVFHFTGSTGSQYLETNILNITRGIIQFDINAACGGAFADFAIEVQYSNTSGSIPGTFTPSPATSAAWLPVLPAQCNPLLSSPVCVNWTWMPPQGSFSSIWLSNSAWTSGSMLLSREYLTSTQGQTWYRVTLPLPAGSFASGLRRYRVVVTRSSSVANWGLSNLYIGDGCGTGCGGHGYCSNLTCVCDTGYVLNGTVCVPLPGLPTELRETFDDGPLSPLKWQTFTGGDLQSAIMMVSQNNAYFAGLNPRKLTTVDLDTRNADVIQFFLMSSGQNMVVSYSNNGGLSWSFLSSAAIQASSSYVIILPAGARSAATRFMFWQPIFNGLSDAWVCPSHDCPCIQPHFSLLHPCILFSITITHFPGC
jgi:hypothetical protein